MSDGSLPVMNRYFSDISAITPNAQNDEKFLDNEFLPFKSSLSQDSKSVQNSQIFQNITWRRASESVSPSKLSKAYVLPKVISPSSLQIGLLNNPYFVCALSILAEKPGLIPKIFNKIDLDTTGLFSLSLNFMGEWRNIVIDDFFPFSTKLNDWAFIRAYGGEWWPQVIEKAYAKMYYSYENIKNGVVTETLMDLIGAPFETFKLSPEKEVWQKIKTNFDKGYLVYCSRKNWVDSNQNRLQYGESKIMSNQEGSVANGSNEDYWLNTLIQRSNSGAVDLIELLDLDSVAGSNQIRRQTDSLKRKRLEEFSEKLKESNSMESQFEKITKPANDSNDLGIMKGYEYAIIDVKELKSGSIFQKPQRLLRIRNPWINVKWKGEWSPSSNKWTPKLIKDFNYDPKKPNNDFWISWEDFIKFYDCVSISKYHEDYQQSVINLKQKNNESNTNILLMVCEVKSHVFLSVNQFDERIYQKNKFSYKYSGCRVMIGRIMKAANNKEDRKLEFVDGLYLNNRNSIIELDLEAGEYIVTIDMLWETSCRDYTFSGYAKEPIKMMELESENVQVIQKNLIKSMCQNDKGILKNRTYSNKNKEYKYANYGGENFGILYFYYRGLSQTRIKIQEIVEIQPFDIELFEDTRIGNNYKGRLVYINNFKFIVDVYPEDEAVILYKTKQIIQVQPQIKFTTFARNIDEGEELSLLKPLISWKFQSVGFIETPQFKINKKIDFPFQASSELEAKSIQLEGPFQKSSAILDAKKSLDSQKSATKPKFSKFREDKNVPLFGMALDLKKKENTPKGRLSGAISEHGSEQEPEYDSVSNSNFISRNKSGDFEIEKNSSESRESFVDKKQKPISRNQNRRSIQEVPSALKLSDEQTAKKENQDKIFSSNILLTDRSNPKYTSSLQVPTILEFRKIIDRLENKSQEIKKDEDKPKEFQEEEDEIIQMIKKSKHPIRRIWKDKFVNCFCYNYQNKDGYYILIENATQWEYKEIVQFMEIKNLKTDAKNMRGYQATFNLKPGKSSYIFLPVINPKKNFNYSHKNMYKFLDES